MEAYSEINTMFMEQRVFWKVFRKVAKDFKDNSHEEGCALDLTEKS